jgi:hypothetical protein
MDEAADDAPEDEEDDENANEKRDGEFGRPTRMTVSFEAAESGLARLGDEVGLSFSGASAICAGLCLCFVRPPEGRIVCAGCCGFGWMVVVGRRVQRSGAE